MGPMKTIFPHFIRIPWEFRLANNNQSSRLNMASGILEKDPSIYIYHIVYLLTGDYDLEHFRCALGFSGSF